MRSAAQIGIRRQALGVSKRLGDCNLKPRCREPEAGFHVENLLIQRVDSSAARTIFLKGFEDGRILSCRTDNAPLRRKRELVFDNLVERASRENVA